MQQTASLFDQLVGNGEQLRIKFEAECLGGLEVDHKLELAGLDHRQIGWLIALRIQLTTSLSFLLRADEVIE